MSIQGIGLEPGAISKEKQIQVSKVHIPQEEAPNSRISQSDVMQAMHTIKLWWAVEFRVDLS